MVDLRPSPLHNVAAWLPRWARLRGDQPAIWDDHRKLDYAALDDRTARLAGWLRARGVGPGDRVALLLANRSAYLEGVFAAARIGAICLPVNARLSPREIAFLLDDCSPSALLYEAPLASLVDKACAAAAHPPAHRVEVGGQPCAYEAALAASAPHVDVAPALPDDPMMLMYTSGTTGAPKGAVLPHRKALYNSLNAEIVFGIRPEDRVLVVAPLFHSLGLLILALPVLYAGGQLVLQAQFDPVAVWRSVAAHRIDYLGGVPTMWQRLEDTLADAPPDRFDLSSLRFLFTAGAAISIDLVRAYERRGLVLKQGYGQTETSILCCLDASDALRKAGSVGKPVVHAEVRVVKLADLDGPPERWRDVAPGSGGPPSGAGETGETGEVVVRGPICMLGYWQRPEATAETLRGEWLRTGDLATVDDEGYVTLVGRARDMLISGGENVYPAEIEAVYAEHPAIREIAVVGVPHPRWGEVGCAHVVLAAGHGLDPEALLAWGRERLAKFKLPAEFVEAESLPRTASGKVQKHHLRQPEPELRSGPKPVDPA